MEKAQGLEEAIGVFVGLVNLAEYGVIIWIVVTGVRLIRRRGEYAVGGALLLGLAAIPFVFWVFDLKKDQELIEARRVEIASWPREKLDPDNLPDAIRVGGDYSATTAKKLAGLGFFNDAYGEGERGEWYRYSYTGAPGCPRTEKAGYSTPDFWKTSTPCVTAERMVATKSADANVVLYLNRSGPGAKVPKGDGIKIINSLELRSGNALIAYVDEARFWRVYTPPLWLFGKPMRYGYRLPGPEVPDPVTFVARAIGRGP